MWPKFKKSWKYKIQVLPFLVSMFFSMRKIIKGENIDVVSSFYLLPCGLLASLNNKISNVPFINTGMGTDVELVSKHKWLKNFIMKKANTNIVLSNDLKNKLGDVKVIPIGLYLDKFEFKPKEKTGITSLLCVGRLNEQKGFQYAIEAVKILIGREQRVYLNIVGEGDYRPQLQALIDKYNLNFCVKLVGPVANDKLQGYYHSSDIFIMSSINFEGLGLVAAEAMACGVPVIASNIGGIPDVVAEGCGLLVEEKNPEQIANKVEYLITNENERVNFINNAYDHVKENFTWGNISKEYNKIIRGVS